MIVALAVDMRDSYDDLTMMNLILGGEGKFVKIVAHRRITDQVIIQPEEARKMFQFLKTAWHQKQAKTQPHG